MELTKLTENVSQISELGTYPRADNNLTIEQLKSWFDKAPEIIKTYLNEELVPELERKLTSFDNRVSIAEERIDDFEQGTGFLSIVGGTMEGPLNVLTPTDGSNAANKDYVDSYVNGKDALYSGVLASGSWNENQQTIAVAASTADKVKTAIWVSPDPEDMDGYNAYLECSVRAVAQQDGAVVFRAEDIPEADIPVHIFVRKLVAG